MPKHMLPSWKKMVHFILMHLLNAILHKNTPPQTQRPSNPPRHLGMRIGI